MSEQDPHINDLFRRYLQGNYTEQELEQLLDYFNLDRHDQQLSTLIAQQFEKPVPEQVNKEAVKAAVQSMDKYVMKHTNPGKPKRSYYLWAGTIAAILLLTCGIAFYFISRDEMPDRQLTSQYGDDVLPGGNRAYITLSNGQRLELDATKSGISVADGNLFYTDGEALLSGADAEYATIITPNGGEYQLVLPDGSHVWINAASSLTYPVKFTEAQRIVTLEGEAYFEVMPNEKLPFIVKSKGQEVQVLGTSFNLNSYPDEYPTVTTLVQGAVSVHNKATDKSVSIAPGQQALNDGVSFTVRSVDVSPYIAWKTNEFVFHYTSLKNIMLQLQRWYDIEVDMENVPNETFYAEISRNVPLSAVLEMIEGTSKLHFEIEGRRLRIRK